MPDLLLELFSEEIPARMQDVAISELEDMLGKSLKAAGFSVFGGQYQSFVTPRRLAIWIKDLPAAQPDVSTELKGPKTNAPEAALQGFLKKNRLAQSELVERDGVYFATVHQKGKPTADVLKIIIEDMLANFPWPKSMRWGGNSITWVRPLHGILCIFDGKVVPVQFGPAGAGNVTYGHRFLSPAAISVDNADEYEALLEKAHVIADREKRKAEILRQAQAAAAINLTLKKDENLLEEVTGLVEFPVVLTGSIDAQFMDLPPEVLTTVMRSHQKYFALEDAGGALSPHFLIVANMQAQDGGKAIIAGNERVLRARFSDARFFWDQDRKKPLSDWAEGLKTVTFHAKLGSIADKVARIAALAKTLAGHVPGTDTTQVARAAALCKADLVTGMVGEFAELQGVMGRYYALSQGEAPEVADAIRDHYKPQGPNDSVPAAPVSICIALADKFDTLISMFAIGEKPTGSKDPFALRRAALGVIRIILENEIRLPLSVVRGDSDLISFLIDRLKVQLKDQGIRHDVINAVIAGDDDLVRVVARAKALQAFLGSDDGANLLVAYRRAANIVSIEEKKDKVSYAATELDKAALKEAEETQLASLLASTAVAMENLRGNEQFEAAMRQLAAMRKPVDDFFDRIMVNCEDKTLRANRLRLLSSIRAAMDSIADFAKIEG